MTKRYCWYCGEDIGEFDPRYYDPRETCGKPACERAARDAEEQERAEAHEQLDRDRGWDRR